MNKFIAIHRVATITKRLDEVIDIAFQETHSLLSIDSIEQIERSKLGEKVFSIVTLKNGKSFNVRERYEQLSEELKEYIL